MAELPHIIIELPSFTKYKAVATLVTDVENLKEIKENLIKGNKEYDYGFINASNVVSLEQIRSAYYKVMVDEKNGGMKTRTLHTEMIYNLCPSKNIMDCLNRYGISKDSKTLLVLKIVESEKLVDDFVSETLKNLQKIVHGNFVDLSDAELQKHVNLKTIEKYNQIKIRGTLLENNWNNISRLLVTSIQLKGL